VAYQMALMSTIMSDLDGHIRCLQPF